MRRTTEIRTLNVTLTEEEVRLKSDSLAQKVAEHQTEQDAEAVRLEGSKAAAKAAQERILGIYGEIRGLAKEVRTRTASRDVPCDWHIDLDKAKAVLVRRDTGEVIDTRAVTDKEKQLALGDDAVRLTEEVARALENYEKQLDDEQQKDAEQQEQE